MTLLECMALREILLRPFFRKSHAPLYSFKFGKTLIYLLLTMDYSALAKYNPWAAVIMGEEIKEAGEIIELFLECSLSTVVFLNNVRFHVTIVKSCIKAFCTIL